jgi:pseudouridylate synthase
MTAPTIGEEVRTALSDHTGVVALETSVIGQGLPHPRNLECIARMDGAVRGAGAVPAWVGVLDGAVNVGLTAVELARFAEPGAATKVARRDVPVATATEALGATTVSATIWAAARAGVAVSATGGIGGVHPGQDADVSADLVELARTPGVLVCSGPKSIIDPIATAEKLEELGVVVVGYGVDRLPFFLSRETSVELEHRADTPGEVAAILRAGRDLQIRSTILVCNPVPLAEALDVVEIAEASRAAQELADRNGVRGKARTPFLLSALAELTGGRSLAANLALLEDNARVAGLVAVAASTTS